MIPVVPLKVLTLALSLAPPPPPLFPCRPLVLWVSKGQPHVRLQHYSRLQHKIAGLLGDIGNCWVHKGVSNHKIAGELLKTRRK